MRRRRRAVVATAILVALVSTVGCSVEPHVEITSGTVTSQEFNSHVTYYDLDLPADVDGLEWVQLRDWDSNQIYVRFSTDRAGLGKVLQGYRLTLTALRPSSSSGAPALPRDSDWVDELPSRFREWQPSQSSTSRESDQVRDMNRDGLQLYVELLVDHPAADRPGIFLHVLQT